MRNFVMNERQDHVEVEFDRGMIVTCGFDYDWNVVAPEERDQYGVTNAAEYNYEINLYDVEGMDYDGDIVVTLTMQKVIRDKIRTILSEDEPRDPSF